MDIVRTYRSKSPGIEAKSKWLKPYNGMIDSNEMTLSLFESRFKNRQYIGSGGFAKVYKAFDHAKNHYVALKVADVRPEWKQFTLLREVELVNKLPNHPNIARYDACYRFDMGVAGEIDFAILKFYEDGNLDQFMSTHTLSSDDTHIIVRGILRGVSFLHYNNYVHRDLKSQNILIQREDGVWTPKITDFGLSRSLGAESTSNNSAIGLSYSYAAPEQIQNRRIHKNVDIWAAGIIIYKMVTGELPFRSSSKADGRDTQSQLELSRMIVNAELPEKIHTLAEPYQAIIKRCLVADPTQRCQNAEELLFLLDGEQAVIGNFHEEEERFDVMLPPPTLFVPVEPPPPMPTTLDMDKTTLVEIERPLEQPSHQAIPPVAPPVPPTSPPPPIRPEYGNGANNSYEIPEYSAPKPDYTQIIEQQRITHIPAEPHPALLTSGEPESKFKWWHILLVLGLIAAGIGVYYYLSMPKTSGYIDGSFEPIPLFEDIKADNEKAKANPEELEKIGRDIEKSLKHYPTDYRWLYELAKNRAYLDKPDEAFEALKRAAMVALDNQRASALSTAISRDTQETFQAIKAAKKENWQQLMNALSQGDKSLIKDI